MNRDRNYLFSGGAQRTPFTLCTQSSSYPLLFSLCSHAGYRHVPLLNKNGDILPSAGLFVHVMVLDAE